MNGLGKGRSVGAPGGKRDHHLFPRSGAGKAYFFAIFLHSTVHVKVRGGSAFIAKSNRATDPAHSSDKPGAKSEAKSTCACTYPQKSSCLLFLLLSSRSSSSSLSSSPAPFSGSLSRDSRFLLFLPPRPPSLHCALDEGG